MKKTVVLVIREISEFTTVLEQSGFEVVNLSLIHTEPAEELNELEEKIRTLDQYDGVFITSPVAAEIFLGKAPENKQYYGKVYVLGERTKNCFAGTDFEMAFSKDANTAEELISSFDEREFGGKNFLFVRGDKSMRTIPWLLRTSAVVDEVVVYRTVPNPINIEASQLISERIDRGEIDWICFFSPSAIDAFINLFGSDAAKIINTAVIGETTATRAKEAGMNLQMISKKASALDFAESLVEHVKQID